MPATVSRIASSEATVFPIASAKVEQIYLPTKHWSEKNKLFSSFVFSPYYIIINTRIILAQEKGRKHKNTKKLQKNCHKNGNAALYL